MNNPCLIKFDKRGSGDLGFLSIAENLKSVPFDVKRIFWLYHVEKDVERGNHAHKETEQVLICVKGEIEFFAEMPDYKEFNFVLNDPAIGVYIPASAWHVMKYKAGTIQLVLASTLYHEDDYFREYEDFESFYRSV